MRHKSDITEWLQSDVLPFWSTDGWDKRQGGFVEQAGPDGRADIEAPRRLRVQARQIHVMAEAQSRGLADTGALAMLGLEYMLSRGRSPDGRPGYVHILNGDGSVRDARRDCYDHAFVLLALSSLLKISADRQIAALVDETLSFLDTQMASLQGGFLEGVPHVPPRRQNPHMHLFEAFLNLYEATALPAYAERASALLDFVSARFLHGEDRLLLEVLDDDLQALAPPAGSVVEPGHMAEWVWLLGRWARLAGMDVRTQQRAMMAGARRFALADGFLPDEADLSGRITRGTRRTWPQTELLKAELAMYEMGEGRREAVAAAETRLEAYLAKPSRAGWIDQFDADGAPIVGPIPASTLYHLFWAIVERERILGSGKA